MCFNRLVIFAGDYGAKNSEGFPPASVDERGFLSYRYYSHITDFRWARGAPPGPFPYIECMHFTPYIPNRWRGAAPGPFHTLSACISLPTYRIGGGVQHKALFIR